MRLNDSEWRVMHVLWREAPCTARDILKALEGETSWSYSTVRTLLTRLTEKHALSAVREGNTLVYKPELARDQAQRSALQGLLDRAFGGAVGGLVHYLADEKPLSKQQRKELESLLAEVSSAPAAADAGEEVSQSKKDSGPQSASVKTDADSGKES